MKQTDAQRGAAVAEGWSGRDYISAATVKHFVKLDFIIIIAIEI